MRNRGRAVVGLVILVAVLLPLQSCTLEEAFFVTVRYLMWTGINDGDTGFLSNTFLPDGVHIRCGYINVNGWYEPKKSGGPLLESLTFKSKVLSEGKETIHKMSVPVKEDGSFFGSMRVPGDIGLNFARDACWVIPPASFLAVLLVPDGRSLVQGDILSVAFGIRPIEQLTKCKKRLIETTKTPSTAQWFKGRPGKSTKKIVAIGSKQGVEVHCRKTKDGEQATLKVVYTDGTKEFIGITCND